MRAFLLLSLLLIIATGCKDNPADSGDFEPYRIGTWLVETPEQASWVGEQSMQKTATYNTTQGDTVEIRTPQNQLVQIIHQEHQERGEFFFTITDSSITDTDSVSARGTRWQFGSGSGSNREQVNIGSVQMSIADDHVFVRLTASIECDAPINGPVITIHYRQEDQTHVVSHRIIANGFVDTVKELTCRSAPS